MIATVVTVLGVVAFLGFALWAIADADRLELESLNEERRQIAASIAEDDRRRAHLRLLPPAE